MNPIYLLILSSLLLFQSPQSVQSISLSRLCGSFGHSCFGANWGKRELPYKSSLTSNKNENQMAMDLEEIRLKLFLQRLRQLFEFE